MFKNKKIHMIGIGGISMSGIALMLKQENSITGSDQNSSALIKSLEDKGIRVTIGSNLKDVEQSDIIIYTAAISENNEELVLAKKLKKEIYERSVALGLISKDYDHTLCVAGTHGKSTTTGLLSLVFLEAKLNPTIQIGAMLNEINGNYYIGDNEFLLIEACEYTDSFLDFFPSSAIITNIDADHLNYFKTLDNIKKSFYNFSKLVPKDGFLILNNDDENSLYLKEFENHITIGIDNDADYTAKNINYTDLGYPTFDIFYKDNFLTNIKLNIRGYHNIYNTLSVVALSKEYTDDTQVIKKGVEKYTGVGRRFEYLGTFNNAQIYDDYAHHPIEIKTTFDSISKMKYNKNYAIFQAHTYSRTHEHLEEFIKVLSKFENVIIAPIFAAREINTFNISEKDLVEGIKKINNNVIYLDSFEKIEKHLREVVQEGDLVITIGAGPINEVAKNLID